jgi:Phosphodiester glycosidase
MKKTLVFTVLIVSIFFLFSFFKNHKNENIEIKKIFSNKVKSSNSSFFLIKIKSGCMKYAIANNVPDKNDFYINANFFLPDGNPIGEVIIDNKKINKKVKGGSFFYTINGKPNISFYNHPKKVDFCCQSILTGIKSNKICKNLNKNQTKSYRTIIGFDRYNNLIIIFSDVFCFITIKEICDVALDNNMINGFLLDGGSSIDIKVNMGNDIFIYQSMPTIVKQIKKISQPPIYIVGNFK